jgi:hypothetical protein
MVYNAENHRSGNDVYLLKLLTYICMVLVIMLLILVSPAPRELKYLTFFLQFIKQHNYFQLETCVKNEISL